MHGNPVAIVSPFEGLPLADDRSPAWLKLDGYRVERILDRKGWGIRFLVAVKRAMQRFLPARAAPTHWSNTAGAQVSAGQQRFSLRWLHHKLFSVIHSVRRQEALGTLRRAQDRGVRVPNTCESNHCIGASRIFAVRGSDRSTTAWSTRHHRPARSPV